MEAMAATEILLVAMVAAEVMADWQGAALYLV